MAQLIYDDVWIDFPLQHVPGKKPCPTPVFSLQKDGGLVQVKRIVLVQGGESENSGFGGNDRNLMMHEKLMLVKRSNCLFNIFFVWYYSRGRIGKESI